jgi:hypothetical protein
MSAGSILVTGDIIRDIYIYQGDRIFPAQQGKIAPHFSDRPGGANGLCELISAVQSDAAELGVDVPSSSDKLQPVHTLWTACEGGTKKARENAPKDKEKPRVWRVSQPLGYALGVAWPSALPRSAAANERHAVLVIDDAGLGFRTLPAKGSWPVGVLHDEKPQPNWIIHKMSNPIAQGDLWRALICRSNPVRRENLIVIVAADELRRAGAAISRGFSWERTLSELCAELNHNPLFQPLLRFPRYLVVNFGCVGAIWFGDSCHAEQSDAPAQDRATLVYDPALPEGGWKTRLADDHAVYGHLNTFTAAITIAVAHAQKNTLPDLDAAIQRGLAACRRLRLLGHGEVSAAKPGPPLVELALFLSPTPADHDAVKTALEELAPNGFQIISDPCGKIDPADASTWTLAAMAENPPDQPGLPLYGLAHRVALYGYAAFQHIPHAHFGDLLSVDRQEIETLRSLTQLIQRYEGEKQPKQPLSIAAFGPPGAGKSFGIKEIARQVLGKDIPILEFNLSQFDSSSDLFGAFHQVRDKALKGLVPVVFWDEFDSREYKWLQYLLAPMQDGTFEENGHTHTIGKCLFVFAGATSWDFEHFGPAPMPEGWPSADVECAPGHDAPAPPADQPAESPVAQLAAFYRHNRKRVLTDQAANDDFRRKKGPDFLSRLDGHIDVLGPNQRLMYNWAARNWEEADPHDITFPIRRALLLRQFLGAKKPEDKLEIDRDLLRAFLHVPRYRHGARSLEKIARHLALSQRPFRRAHLPPPQVLAQHLDSAAAFDAVYHRNRTFLTDENLRRIAAAIDENYSRHVDETDAKKAAAQQKPYQARATLSEEKFVAAFEAKLANSDHWQQWLAATNIAAARRLPDILALAGLRLESGTATPEEQAKVAKHLKSHLDPLSREEHALWMQFHKENGWRQADDALLDKLVALRQSDEGAHKAEIKRLKKEERIHTLIVPFDELPESEKPKDHDAIKNFPGTVALVAWKITFVRE